MKLVQDVTHPGYSHNPLSLSLSILFVKYYVATLPCVITPAVSHLSFQRSMIERIISGTLSNILEFPFDYDPRSLFIDKGLIIGWISLVEMETNFIGRNNGQFSSTKHGMWRILLLIQLLQLQHLWARPHSKTLE